MGWGGTMGVEAFKTPSNNVVSETMPLLIRSKLATDWFLPLQSWQPQ